MDGVSGTVVSLAFEAGFEGAIARFFVSAEIALGNRRVRRLAMLSTLAARVALDKPPSMIEKEFSLHKSA
jgi:hypothetical protein